MRFDKKFLSLPIIIGLCIPTLVSLYPSYAYASEQEKTREELMQEHEQKEQAREMAQIAQHKVQFINASCQAMPMSFQISIMLGSVLSPVEFTELDVRNLIGISDMPLTALGHAGLRWLSLPITNYAEISRRQGVIRELVQNESSFDQLRLTLQNIKKGEDALITYWNKDSKLHYFIKKNVLPKKTKKPKKLSWWGEKQYALTEGMYGKQKDEESRTVPALEVAALSPFFKLVGFTLNTYLNYCLAQMMWRPVSDWGNPKAWAQEFMPTKDKGADIYKKVFEDLWWPISPWDRMRVKDPENPGSYKPGVYAVWDYAQGEWKDAEKTVPEMGPWHAYQVPFNGSAKDKFAFGADLAQHLLPELSNNHPWVKNVAGAGLVSTMAFRYYFYNWGYFKICNIWKDGKKLVDHMHLLHASLVDIAKSMRALKELQKHIATTAAFNGSNAQSVLQQIMGKSAKTSPEFKELMELLHTKTFDSADSFLYSRGRVLRAHILLQEVRDKELVPLLQAVAELDGYCSIARLMKAYEHKENKFVFAEFVSSDTPCINIRSCWEPLAPTKNPVVNDIRLGADGKPVRMIITGPNGGGKSTFLKSVGHAVIMAQSWGIVPADKAELTIFNALRTSLDPKEDLSAGISKFTAQKERIEGIGNLMKQSTASNKMLVILDEPFTGTIDDQMADRVHQFGLNASRIPHAALCIATHVQKPVELARNGSFVNYQIEIQEPQIGQFVRTFKVKEGAAQWWFNDKPRVTRFIDWLNPVSMRQNSAGHGGQVAGVPGGKQVGTQPGRTAVAS